MAFVLNDRVKETTTSTGTGTINLAGAADTFETFVAGIGTTNKCFYCSVLPSEREIERSFDLYSLSLPTQEMTVR